MTMSQHKPRDADWNARVRASFDRQQVMHTLGMTISRLLPGEVDLAFRHDHKLTQQHGFIHAGIMTTALDSACGYAAFSLMAADAAVLTIELKTNLLAPAKGTHFRAEGRVVKAGRTITVTEGKAYALDDASQNAQPRLIATMTATMMAITGRENVKG